MKQSAEFLDANSHQHKLRPWLSFLLRDQQAELDQTIEALFVGVGAGGSDDSHSKNKGIRHPPRFCVEGQENHVRHSKNDFGSYILQAEVPWNEIFVISLCIKSTNC